MMDERYKDCFLFFDEGPHKYTDSYGREYKSVTTLLHEYQPKFDDKYWVHKKAKEQGVSEKEVRRQWDQIKNEACKRGTETHNGIEDAIKEVSMFKNAIKYLTSIDDGRVVTVADIPFMKARPLDIDKFIEATDNKYPKIYEVFSFYVDRGYTIYSEIGAYLLDYLISGTIDILCIKENQFVILDWKTNREGLQFEAGYYKKDKSTTPAQVTNEFVRKKEFLNPPLSHLPNCNGSIYNMQLSMYAFMVETILGIPCKGLGLCHIGSPFVLNKYGMPFRDKNGYHLDPNGTETVTWYGKNYLPYRRQECINILEDRKKELEATYIANGAGQLTINF